MVMRYHGISIHCTIHEMGITQERYICRSTNTNNYHTSCRHTPLN